MKVGTLITKDKRIEFHLDIKFVKPDKRVIWRK